MLPVAITVHGGAQRRGVYRVIIAWQTDLEVPKAEASLRHPL